MQVSPLPARQNKSFAAAAEPQLLFWPWWTVVEAIDTLVACLLAVWVHRQWEIRQAAKERLEVFRLKKGGSCTGKASSLVSAYRAVAAWRGAWVG